MTISETLKSLEGSAIFSRNNISYHGKSLKVEFTAIRGNDMNYYYLIDNDWIKCSKAEFLIKLAECF